MRSDKIKLGKMLETLVMSNLLAQNDAVRMVGIEPISREGYSVLNCTDTPSETATPALVSRNANRSCKMKIQSNLQQCEEFSMRPLIWVERTFPIPLQTAEQNYWLGMLMADGYIQRANGTARLCLELAAKDASHVSRFGKFVGKRPYSSRNRVRVVKSCSKELDILSRHGIVPRKTGNEHWPKTVTDDWAFLRGVLDGDGSVGVYGRCLSLSFVSASEEFLYSIASKLFTTIGSFPDVGNCGDRQAKRICYSIGHAKTCDLYAKLYATEPCFLRKRRIIRLFVERPSPKSGRPKVSC